MPEAGQAEAGCEATPTLALGPAPPSLALSTLPPFCALKSIDGQLEGAGLFKNFNGMCRDS